MSDTPNKHTDPHVAVVADEGEDGSYEIRVERNTQPTPTVAPDAVASSALRPASPRESRWGLWGSAGVAALVLVGTIVTLTRARNPSPPPVVEAAPIETFRAYTFDVAEPQLLRATALGFDTGALRADEPDAGTAEPDTGASAQASVDAGAVEAAAETDDVGFAPRPIDSRAAERLRAVRVSPSAVVIPVERTDLPDEIEVDLGDDDELAADDDGAFDDDESFEDDEDFDDEDYEDDEGFEDDEDFDDEAGDDER